MLIFHTTCLECNITFWIPSLYIDWNSMLQTMLLLDLQFGWEDHNKVSKHDWLLNLLWKHMLWWIMCESLLPVLPVSEMLLTDAQISCLMHKFNSFIWQQKLSPKNCGIRISSCSHNQNCSFNNEDAPYACRIPILLWSKLMIELGFVYQKKKRGKKEKKKLVLFT